MSSSVYERWPTLSLRLRAHNTGERVENLYVRMLGWVNRLAKALAWRLGGRRLIEPATV
jgi:hypothetical protein